MVRGYDDISNLKTKLKRLHRLNYSTFDTSECSGNWVNTQLHIATFKVHTQMIRRMPI
jgi:hypothetical protein